MSGEMLRRYETYSANHVDEAGGNSAEAGGCRGGPYKKDKALDSLL